MGSSEMSYKVITVYSPHASVDYLEVKEFEEGPVKPFVYKNMGGIYTGTCKHWGLSW